MGLLKCVLEYNKYNTKVKYILLACLFRVLVFYMKRLSVVGLGRCLSGEECLPLLQKIQNQFLEPAWYLAAT